RSSREMRSSLALQTWAMAQASMAKTMLHTRPFRPSTAARVPAAVVLISDSRSSQRDSWSLSRCSSEARRSDWVVTSACRFDERMASFEADALRLGRPAAALRRIRLLARKQVHRNPAEHGHDLLGVGHRRIALLLVDVAQGPAQRRLGGDIRALMVAIGAGDVGHA